MDVRRRNLMGQVPITANVTIENIKGSWGESSKTISGYNVYESKSSYLVNNGYDLAKVTFSGYPEFTFLYGSYGESSYDFVVISPLDYVNAQNWTNSSYSGSLLSTSGKQSSSAPNLSYTFTNDGGEHFFYILYKKDSGVNSGADRGYIAFRQSNYLEIDKSEISVDHKNQTILCNIISDMDWSAHTKSDWIMINTNQGSGNNTLSITIDLNDTLVSRTGQVTIYAGNHTSVLTITQTQYDINVPNQVSVQYEKITTINVTAELGLSVNYSCEWLECNITNTESEYHIYLTSTMQVDDQTVIILTSGNLSKQVIVKYGSDCSIEVSLIDGDFTLYDYDNNITFTPYNSLYLKSDGQGTSFNRQQGFGIIYKNITNDIKSISFEYFADATKTGNLSNSWGGIFSLCNPNSSDGSYNYLVVNKYPSDGIRVEMCHRNSYNNFNIDSTTNASRGTWHKVCVTTDYNPDFQGSSQSFNAKYYADGILIGTCYGYYNTLTYSTCTLIIGNSWRLMVYGTQSSDINPFCGTVRNVKMWRKTLTDSELETESTIQ